MANTTGKTILVTGGAYGGDVAEAAEAAEAAGVGERGTGSD